MPKKYDIFSKEDDIFSEMRLRHALMLSKKKQPDFEIINFTEVCELLKEDKFFVLFFYGPDDLNDGYFTILLDNRDWIAKTFDTPSGESAFLIEKNEDTKEMLVDYIKELNRNTDYESIYHWDNLIMVTFDGNYHIIESTVKHEYRRKYAEYFRENYDSIFKNLKFPDL